VKVRPISLDLEERFRDAYGDMEQRAANSVAAQRAPVADLDGSYEYSLVNLCPLLHLEKVGGNGHFTQLDCRIKIPTFNKEEKRKFGVTIIEPNKTTTVLLPFNSTFSLGKIKPQAADMTLDILDAEEILLSRTVPIAFQ